MYKIFCFLINEFAHRETEERYVQGMGNLCQNHLLWVRCSLSRLKQNVCYFYYSSCRSYSRCRMCYKSNSIISRTFI